MARTQIGSDLILNGSIAFEDLADSVNAFGAKEPKIYRISKYPSNFQEIDYTILNLFPQRYFRRGELYKCEWFKDIEMTDKVLIVDIEYSRDWAGFANLRTTTRTWVNNDESLNIYTKVTIKNYAANAGETVKEGKKRRDALVDNIQVPVLTAMHQVLIPTGWDSTDIIYCARWFMDEYEKEFSKFIKNSSTINDKHDPNYGRKRIIVKIEEESEPYFTVWLDTPLVSLGSQTIREFLISEFSI